MMLNMQEYYEMINKLNLSIIYNGPIWAEGVDGIAETLRKRLSYDELPLSASQSVFSVFVEQMNNMLMYSAEKEVFTNHEKGDFNVSKGVFLLGAQDKTYFIQSGNVVKKDSVDLIQSRIEHLNTLDKKELRKFYKEQIKADNNNPESRGGGIGLIEIARRASSKIEYSFAPHGEETVFFSMYVEI